MVRTFSFDHMTGEKARIGKIFSFSFSTFFKIYLLPKMNAIYIDFPSALLEASENFANFVKGYFIQKNVTFNFIVNIPFVRSSCSKIMKRVFSNSQVLRLQSHHRFSWSARLRIKINDLTLCIIQWIHGVLTSL